MIRRACISSAVIAARLDRLPVTRSGVDPRHPLSLGGFFEFYDMFFTGYIGPGLVRSHILTPPPAASSVPRASRASLRPCSPGFFWMSIFSFLADRLGRRAIFTYSLLVVFGGHGRHGVSERCLRIEPVAIHRRHRRGCRACHHRRVSLRNRTCRVSRPRVRVQQRDSVLSVTVVAFLSWLLVPRAPFGLDGWRWVMLIAAVGAIVVWWIRLRVPESPRWLARHGRIAEADRIMDQMEAGPLPRRRHAGSAGRFAGARIHRGSFAEIWKGPYLRMYCSRCRSSIWRRLSAITASRTGCLPCWSSKALR